MAQIENPIEVYLEIGRKRTFAAALDWPGWCRSAADEAVALQALCDFAPRYARLLLPAQLGFRPPLDPSELLVVERLAGNAVTDFGAPNFAPSRDARPVDPPGLERLLLALDSCWQAFDAAVSAASGKTLSKGPRGGGRDLDHIVQHVLEADVGYLVSLGGKLTPGSEITHADALARTRQVIRTTLIAAAHGEIPARGPRGGTRWTPRYFVRRLAWHGLDHAWEIEDRLV